jgi:hypothetical protein
MLLRNHKYCSDLPSATPAQELTEPLAVSTSDCVRLIVGLWNKQAAVTYGQDHARESEATVSARTSSEFMTTLGRGFPAI